MIAEACPPADTGSGRGPLAASYRVAMTQMTMGGSGVSEANGVLRNHYYSPGVTIYIEKSRESGPTLCSSSPLRQSELNLCI